MRWWCYTSFPISRVSQACACGKRTSFRVSRMFPACASDEHTSFSISCSPPRTLTTAPVIRPAEVHSEVSWDSTSLVDDQLEYVRNTRSTASVKNTDVDQCPGPKNTDAFEPLPNGPFAWLVLSGTRKINKKSVSGSSVDAVDTVNVIDSAQSAQWAPTQQPRTLFGKSCERIPSRHTRELLR